MKLRSTLLMAALLPALWLATGCHKDKDTHPASQDKLKGSWSATMIVETTYEGDNVLERDTTVVPSPDWYVFTFDGKNSLLVTTPDTGTEPETAYYEIQGDQIVVKSSQDASLSANYNYTLAGDKLELTVRQDIIYNGVERKLETHAFFTRQ